MTLSQAEYYQRIALHIGLIFVGLLLIIGAINQHRTGETYGLRAQGVIRRSERPAYFAFLFYSRLILGPIAVLSGIFLK